MKKLACRLLLILFVFVNAHAMAQQGYAISGTIKDENNQPVKGATIFISGSQKITSANDAGEFTFYTILPGYYNLSVKMLGYLPYSQNIEIKDKPADLHISLKVKTNQLKEVVIGKSKSKDLFMRVFKQQFLGATENGQACVLLNPGAVNFSTKKEFLMADADEFLVVENKNLGYKIRYMLKSFWYNAATDRTDYSGDALFEEMPGTEKMKQKWAKKRLEAYNGSLVHFLRAVYTNTVLKEGFLVYKTYPKPAKNANDNLVYIDPRPVKFDSLFNVVDTAFLTFKAIPLLVRYDPKQAAKIVDRKELFSLKGVTMTGKSTLISFPGNETAIDRKGVFKDYEGMSITGDWGMSRLGDKVPLEYQPPK
ncbi:carboxypeptidase-like regulatory domain-containing protein [Mucilaginibacter corticis]|uniref:Carboxypeptidase-like regulatory domain-containing protein n=1 Tax=Mucilaginibacter corticis TaxID=2597670 RepID=A0A556MU49_9SPHI|nr:carboxypeptidase-like regulatory domain-containing protein [Mucilaginibacter corticis]TSJ43318.1 carboxypeptidase-like regulatory domain-containing protein [Mucilaginibacter corticis]